MMENKKTIKRCPICGKSQFHVKITAEQTWLAYATGQLAHAITTCDNITHRPSDDDIWTCANCGFSGKGTVFNLTDKPVKTIEIMTQKSDGTVLVPIVVELYKANVSVKRAIEAAVKDWIKTPEGREHMDDYGKVTYADLSKIPDEIFRQHDIGIAVRKTIRGVIPYDTDLTGRKKV